MKLPVWPKDSFQIIDEDGVHVCFVKSVADRDFIVQAISCHEKYKEALEHIIEYWNRDENPVAMSDALWHILETTEQALKEKP